MPTPKLSDSPQASDSRVRSARKRAGLGWVKGAGLGWVKGAGPGWVKRSLRLGLLLVVTTSLALVLLIAVYIALAWPRMSDQLQLPGLKAPVLIQHDDAGVVHVLADSSRDAWFALGALHARERLWQLEMNRRIAQGRLSELFGASTLPTDRFLRSLDLQPLAKRQLRGASASLQEQLQAYADGVNAWVAQMKVYPPEFLLLKSWSEGPYFEPYRPEDAQAWSLVMALDLGGNHAQEIARLELARHLSMTQLQDLMPPIAKDLGAWYRELAVYRPIAPPNAVKAQASEKGWLPRTVSLHPMAQVMPQASSAQAFPGLSLGEGLEGLGSNDWVLDGSRSASGKPLLANDPHLGLSAPTIWHIAHLRAPGLDVIGGVLIGIPAVVLGRNSQVAWGFTNTGPDVQTSVDTPKVNTSLNTSGIPGLPTADGNTLKQAQDAVYSQATSRLDPQWQTAETQKDTQLRNQGLTPGTEAYDNAMRDFNFAKNDAYSGARNASIQQGLAAEQAQFGMGLQANQTGFNQALNQGQFANQATGQNFNQGLAAGQFQNTAAQNALAQQAQLYNMPLNQLTALMSGSQVTNPQFGQSPQQQTTTGPNYSGAAQSQGSWDQGLYNAGVGQANSFNSGLMNIAGMAAMNFSDRRLKSNIERVGVHPLGIGIYEYDIFDRRERGVMADEVLTVMPE
ncbi:MAG: hypothetical protein EBW71_04450, partial [Betaproteobacteria bacterium]|nr:hypothetical protein [Betaproteobacteria bacterium]